MILEWLKHPFVAYYLSAALVVFPVARIFMRAGFKGWWAAFLAAPFVGFILCLAVLTFKRWPLLQKGGA